MQLSVKVLCSIPIIRKKKKKKSKVTEWKERRKEGEEERRESGWEESIKTTASTKRTAWIPPAREASKICQRRGSQFMGSRQAQERWKGSLRSTQLEGRGPAVPSLHLVMDGTSCLLLLFPFVLQTQPRVPVPRSAWSWMGLHEHFSHRGSPCP